jgi:hypothetical protein
MVCRSGFTTLLSDYYKSSLLWFIVGWSKALVCSSRMDTRIYVLWTARA